MKIRCEVCQVEGERADDTYCPEGWLYGMSAIEPGDDTIPFSDGERRIFLSYVCSPECGTRFWCPGPGNDMTNAPYIEEQDRKREDARNTG